jgi:protein-disulfide isomerase
MMTTPLTTAEPRLVQPLSADDHVRGTPAAAVTLIEYGDFQCPFCGAAYPVVQELMRLRSDSVRFAFRHFPITNAHPYAELAAEVSEAAGARDKFWPMHDWLFENQDQINAAGLGAGVQSLGLPFDAVDREVSEHVWADRVRRDFVGGVRSGVNGTPSFFVNGMRHDLGNDLPGLLSAIDLAAEAS